MALSQVAWSTPAGACVPRKPPPPKPPPPNPPGPRVSPGDRDGRGWPLRNWPPPLPKPAPRDGSVTPFWARQAVYAANPPALFWALAAGLGVPDPPLHATAKAPTASAIRTLAPTRMRFMTYQPSSGTATTLNPTLLDARSGQPRRHLGVPGSR